MEENSTALKWRNSVPSSVEIPTNDRKPLLRTSTYATNGHHHATSPPPSAPSSSFSGVDFELISLKSPTYISLRDILPSSPSVLSPTATAFVANTTTTTSASSTYSASGGTYSLSGYEISIRNRLVKQAAWAYLQPMSSSPSSSGGRIWRCFSGDFLKPFLEKVKCGGVSSGPSWAFHLGRLHILVLGLPQHGHIQFGLHWVQLGPFWTMLMALVMLMVPIFWSHLDCGANGGEMMAHYHSWACGSNRLSYVRARVA